MVERLIDASVIAAALFAICGLAKTKIIDPITEIEQDVDDLTVLISDLSGKEEE
jgi:hypothetical protein